jgi:hypothetical protein
MPCLTETEKPGDAAELRCLNDDWMSALAGDTKAQNQWQNVDGGNCWWSAGGLHLKRGGSEWYSLAWNRCDSSVLRNLSNFKVEVTVEGKANAAGISFGAFRDFLIEGPCSRHHLQLEVDAPAGKWQLRVDGQLSHPKWWNSNVRSANDILSGVLTLKARGPEDVMFRDLRLHGFQSSCTISVVLVCNRFLQRLRITLRNWCHQDAPAGAYEILVLNPSSPDGTHEHMRAATRSYSDIRLCELAIPSKLATNKGAMINYAIPFARGEWIWLTDADCLFPTTAVSAVLDYVKDRRPRLYFGQRRYLTDVRTAELLAGRIDPALEFDRIAHEAPPRPHENAPWGYTQVVPRSVFARAHYSEAFNHFAHSDTHFVEACRKHGLPAEQIPGLFCLHLDHPFAWYGNPEFL